MIYDASKYKKPSVTVDICICTIIDNKLKILLIKRKNWPFKGHWALPGGFLEIDAKETLEETALRELKEETGLENVYLEQLKTYGDPDRDPRLRVISVAYYALIPYDNLGNVKAGSDAKEADWFSISGLTKNLAFDHAAIITDLIKRLEGKIWYSPIAFSFLPRYFTWAELKHVYEIIMGKSVTDTNFRRKIINQYNIAEVKNKRKTFGRGRPSRLYTYLEVNS